MKPVGSRLQVFANLATRTSGGLRKKDLVKHAKTGKIVSKKKQQNAKKNSNLSKYLTSRGGKPKSASPPKPKPKPKPPPPKPKAKPKPPAPAPTLRRSTRVRKKPKRFY